MAAGVFLILLSYTTNLLAYPPHPFYAGFAWALLIIGVAVTGLGARKSTLKKRAGGLSIMVGCVVVYATSLFAWAPQSVGGYMQWGIPFQWHSVGTGNGEPMFGPYHYVVLFNLCLDSVFWCALATVVAYTL